MSNVLNLQRLAVETDAPEDCSLISINCSNKDAEIQA